MHVPTLLVRGCSERKKLTRSQQRERSNNSFTEADQEQSTFENQPTLSWSRRAAQPSTAKLMSGDGLKRFQQNSQIRFRSRATQWSHPRQPIRRHRVQVMTPRKQFESHTAMSSATLLVGRRCGSINSDVTWTSVVAAESSVRDHSRKWYMSSA